MRESLSQNNGGQDYRLKGSSSTLKNLWDFSFNKEGFFFYLQGDTWMAVQLNKNPTFKTRLA